MKREIIASVFEGLPLLRVYCLQPVDWNFKVPGDSSPVYDRTPRGCVDWNGGIPLLSTRVNDRTPRGCVDWNVVPGHSSCESLRVAPSAGGVDWNVTYAGSIESNLSRASRGACGLKWGLWVEIFTKSPSCVTFILWCERGILSWNVKNVAVKVYF